MDGIDVSLVRTNGVCLKRLNKNYFFNYQDETKEILLNIFNESLEINQETKKFLDEVITNEYYTALNNLDILEEADLIGFHGQTIYHNPKNKVSIQLGNPQKLAKLLDKNVIFDFRSNDILMGGQGAPLAPIYHKYIIESSNLEKPTCILNIGGVANITYWDGDKLVGFDTGPGNALMDSYISQISNKSFDKNGILASKGTPDQKIIESFLRQDFFKKTPPKSLDKHSFKEFYNELLKKKYSDSDMMATLLELTVESIVSSLPFLPKTVNNIVIAGGGYRNNHLIKRLKDKLKIEFLNEEQLGINFDYIEAELIAYLAARSIYKLPITFPSTTGVSEPLSGGTFYSYL